MQALSVSIQEATARMRSQSKKKIITGLVSMTGAALLAMGSLTLAAYGEPAWTTYHRDAARSGNDPDAGQPIAPSLAWHSQELGAPIYGQPLVLGSRVYVATVGDRLYALEANSGKVIWEKSAGVPVPSVELPCGNITPTVGIVGTPVIDPATNAIYAVADTWDAIKKEAHHVLKGYSLSGGQEVLSTPVDPPGSDPKAQLQRTALNLDGSDVIFGMGGNDGDCSDYRGMIAAAPESGGSPLYWRYEPAAPAISGGAVWGTSGPAVDGEGHVYATTGNPNGGAETYDYSDSVLQLNPSLELTGYFKPPTWLPDSNSDRDLGSAGAELLPGGLLLQAGKNGIGYLIDETKMGSGVEAVYSHQVCAGNGSFGGDAYASGVIYIPCTNGVQALAYNQAARTFTALWQGPTDAVGPPILSGGLVWSLATGGFSGGGTKLYGLDPSTGVARYTEALPSPIADHFSSPSAAGGRLFVASGSSVTAFTLSVPHWYRNEVKLAEGTKLPMIEWGTLRITNPTLGEVECHNIIAGYVENPTGGGAAVGKVQAFVPYECVSESCKALGGTRLEVTAEQLPWSGEVTHPEEGVFRMRTGNSTKAAGAVFERAKCVGKIDVQFSGEDAPRVLDDGSVVGVGPDEEEFDQPGSGELESEILGGGKIAGRVKLEGYSAEELLEVKNP
jgi:outer membrane protein assembly factor BamB